MTPTPFQRSSFLQGLLRRQALLTLGTFAIALLCFGTTSCNSTGKPKVRENIPPMRITVRDFRSGLHWSIVNDKWLIQAGVEGATPEERKISFRSRRVDVQDSTSKVFEDGVVDAYVQLIRDNWGIDELMVSGPIGDTSVIYSSALELIEGSQVRHVGGGKNVQGTVDEKMRYHNARQTFFDIYNSQVTYQAVQDPYAGGQTP